MGVRRIAIRAALVCAAAGLGIAAWSATAHAADHQPAAEQPAGLLGGVTQIPDELVDQVAAEPEQGEGVADKPSAPAEPERQPQQAPDRDVTIPAPIGKATAPIADTVPPIPDSTAPIAVPVQSAQPPAPPVTDAVAQILPAVEPVAEVTMPRWGELDPASLSAVAAPASMPAPVTLAPVAVSTPRPVDDHAEPEHRQPLCDDAETRAERPAGVRPAPTKRVVVRALKAPVRPCPAPISPADLCQAIPVGVPGGQHSDQLVAMITGSVATPILRLLRTFWPRADVASSRADHPEPRPA